MSVQSYNEITPYELNLHILEYNQKAKQDQEERIVLVYMSAAWTRAKKMPNLKQLLAQEQPKKPQTVEGMLEEVKKLNAAFGGSVY